MNEREVNLGEAPHFSIAGFVFPAEEESGPTTARPILISIDGSIDMFLPVFASKAELDEFMQLIGVLVYRVKVVADQFDFIPQVINAGIRIAANPRKSAEAGKVRWTEVTL